MNSYNTHRRQKMQKMFTLVGSILLVMPTALHWFWGSISVYALSFLVFRLNLDKEVQEPWIISLNFVFWILGMFLISLLSKYIDIRLNVIMASVIFNGALCFCYYAIQNSLILLTIIIGVFDGLASGLLFGNAVDLVVGIADGHVGLFTSLLSSSCSFGSMIIIQVLTRYTNPQNDVPTHKLGSTTYFIQEEIIEKTPSMFIVLGCLASSMHALGLLFLQFNPSMKFIKCDSDKESENSFLFESDPPTKIEYWAENNAIDLQTFEYCKAAKKDYTPKEILKTKTFYALCISFCLANFSLILLLNFYKLFGQMWIQDDHFLTDLGTVITGVVTVSRALCGLALDKVGPKVYLLMLLGSIVLAEIWFYFTAMIDQWLYFFTALIFGGLTGALESSYLSLSALIFGKTHVTINFGLVLSLSICFNMIVPYLVNTVLTSFGWFAIFAGAGGLNIIGMILCVTFVP